ncbi:MAG: ATP synthase F1 subunit gamma, partial [Treponema sp.]|nr:ATP synthase F1 subunit gamma [Treponema sp.]
MANLRDIRLRMRAIQQTLQVTKAMNLISTSKLRKGRRTLEDTEPYFTRIKKAVFDIVSSAGNVRSDFFRRKEVKHTAVVVISSDKGLAGGYNANVFKQVNKVCETLREPLLITIGNTAFRHFSHSPFNVLENFSFASQLPSLDNAKEIADYIISQFLWGYFDEVHLVYTHMFSAVKLVPENIQLLPISAEKIQEEIARAGGVKRVDLRFEYIPSEEEVFDALVPIYIKGVIYGALVEAYASEQSARMTAMDESSKNAEDMLAKLQVFYNRMRQAVITQEMT